MSINQPVKQKPKQINYKYIKPSQPIYRPPSARLGFNRASEESPESHSSSTTTSTTTSTNDCYHYYQQSIKSPTSVNFRNKTIVDKKCQKSDLKRSKSFGGKAVIGGCESIEHLFDTKDDISYENQALIRRAIEKSNSVTTTQLMQIVRLICMKAIEKTSSAQSLATICLTIDAKQCRQTHNNHVFIESLINCLREWFTERDKLRLTSGGARRWISYVTFVCRLYHNLKTNQQITSNPNNRHSFYDTSDNDFDNNYQLIHSTITTDRSQEDNKDKDNDKLVDTCVANKQQKQFMTLLYDSFQAILANPNSTPAEIECLHTCLRDCGKYLEEDNCQRMKTLMNTIRDTFLSFNNQLINCQKYFLEIIELHSSHWQFSQAQLIYYFPYTKSD